MGNYHWKSMVTGYLVSLMAGMCVSLGTAMIFAVLIGKEVLGEGAVGYGAMISVFAGSMVAGVVSCQKMDLPRLAICVSSGALYWLTLMLWGWLIFGNVTGGILPTAGICLGGALLVCILGRKGSGKPKYKVPKSHF